MFASILKGTSEKQGISLWALEHWIFQFLTGRCPISEQHLHLKHSHHSVPRFYIASYCATSAQTPKPPATIQPNKMPLDLCNFLVSLLLCTSAAWCARLNKDSELSAFWSQDSHPCWEAEITGVLPEPLPTSCSESLTTSLLLLMDLPSAHTAWSSIPSSIRQQRAPETRRWGISAMQWLLNEERGMKDLLAFGYFIF